MKKYFMMIVLFVPMMYMNLFSGETGLELTLRGGLTTIVTPFEHIFKKTRDTVGLFSEGETYGLNINYKVSKLFLLLVIILLVMTIQSKKELSIHF